MLFYAAIAAHALSRAAADDAEPDVCLLQFMHKKEDAGSLDDAFDFRKEALWTSECRGTPFVASADPGRCSRAGAEMVINFGDESIEDGFGDNVLVRRWKYFLQDCEKELSDCQIIHPDVYNRKFEVGKTVVRVEGYDLSGNLNGCHRTVFIIDEEPPVFVEPEVDMDEQLELRMPADSCSYAGQYVFAEYEDRAMFSGIATDNCDTAVQVARRIFDAEGELLFDSRTDQNYPNFTGPGGWSICYEATDDYSEQLESIYAFGSGAPENARAPKKSQHCVAVTLIDKTPPDGFQDCPDDIFVTISADRTSADVFWTPPTILSDNCQSHGSIPEAKEMSDPPKEPGMTFPVGSHVVSYSFSDASGNVLRDAECTFTIEVKQRNQPVTLTCPTNVTFDAVQDANFAIVKWDAPVAVQEGKALPPESISYPQGVAPGMPFPYGTTAIKVRAEGNVSGHDTHLMYDECTFFVTVEDMQKPLLDGRLYRCMDENVDLTMYAPPYRVCSGTDLDWKPHDGSTYFATHGYSVEGVLSKNLQCCRDENDVRHECVPVKTSVDVAPLASYCVPAQQ
jgi:hypothetical protein